MRSATEDIGAARVKSASQPSTTFDRLSLLAALVIAAATRLPGIESRGRFEVDQGQDMLTLVAFVRDGIVPLLGPKTSVGEFHHGAFYYFLLAPAAAVSNGDPVAVVAFLALLGIAAVGITWWLARSIGGPLAGAMAGLLLAVSPAAVEESTFIWNPNPSGFFAVLALAAAWRANTGGRARWWALALGAAGAVTQLHVLGVVFLVAILGLCVLGLGRDRHVVSGVLGGIGLIVLLFLPLIIHEVQTGFLETRSVLDYLHANPEQVGGGPVAAIAITSLRVVGWPLVGLVTDVPGVSVLMVVLTLGLVAIGLIRARGAEANGLRWLVTILVWSTVALALAAPSLQRVTIGYPNDHYHAFLDPIVVMLVAVPAAALLGRAVEEWRAMHHGPALVIGVSTATVFSLVLGFAVLRNPPAMALEGGWPAARSVGIRVEKSAKGMPTYLISLPAAKSTADVAFPVVHAGGRLTNVAKEAAFVIVVCDPVLQDLIEGQCGGQAEDIAIDGLAIPGYRLADRFGGTRGTSISLYAR